MSMNTLMLRVLLGDHPHVMALKAGQIGSSTVRLTFENVKMAYLEFKRVVRDLEFDVAELALVTYLQARACGKPLVLLPAVVFAVDAPHQFLVCRRGQERLTPHELAGRRVGIRARSVTTVMWVLGVLQNDYGVDLDRVHWVAHEAPHVIEFQDPVNVERAPPGKKLIKMLLDGEVDAAILSREDISNPFVQPLIPAPLGAADAWSNRHGIRPINHMMVVKQSLVESHPSAVHEMFRMLEENMALAGIPSGRLPMGVEANRKSLQTAIDYALQQHLIPHRLQVDELFDDTTRTLGA